MSRRPAELDDERSTLQLMQETLRQNLANLKFQQGAYETSLQALRHDQSRKEHRIDSLLDKIERCRRQRNKCESDKNALVDEMGRGGGGAAAAADDDVTMGGGHVYQEGKGFHTRPQPTFDDTHGQTVPKFKRGKTEKTRETQRTRGRRRSGISSLFTTDTSSRYVAPDMSSSD